MEILEARENRKFNILKMKEEYAIVTSVKCNMVGTNKNLFPSHLLIDRFANLLIEKKNKIKIEYYESSDGPYYLLGLNEKITKEELIEFENLPLGRIIDIDIYEDEKSISRTDLNLPRRKCIVCHNDAFFCIRNKSHSFEEVYEKILRETLTVLIDESMENELLIENKFGLVTKKSNGSHPDMNYSLMTKAKNAIIPYLVDLFFLGYKEEKLELTKIRELGKKAEEAMFVATNNINCYQGLIFILGITLVSFGHVLKFSLKFDDIFTKVSDLTKGITKEISDREYQGARGEVESGLENVRKAITYYEKTNNKLMTLIYIIQNIDDTILIKRSKTKENYQKYKKLISKITNYDEYLIKEVSDIFIRNNLSCGGSADLLIVTLFLSEIKKDFKI